MILSKKGKQNLSSIARKYVEKAISNLHQALEIDENEGIIDIGEDGNMQAAYDLLHEVIDHLSQFINEEPY